MQKDLYIYYRADEAHADAISQKVHALQKSLQQTHQIAGYLKRRPEVQDGQITWMEVYEAVPSDFDAILAAAVEQSGLAALTAGKRHVETFLDVPACA